MCLLKGAITFLYFRRKFDWDMTKFGSYVGIFGFLNILGQFIVVPVLSSKVGLHDTTVGSIAMLGYIFQAVMLCFTPEGKPKNTFFLISPATKKWGGGGLFGGQKEIFPRKKSKLL